MNGERELVTVFRSADPSAKGDARDVCDLLSDMGLSPVVWDDDMPGVPSGAHEVRVPAEEAEAADRAIAAAQDAEPETGDPSHSLDLQTIFTAIGATAELEALGVKNVLEANGIPTSFVSPPMYPNLRFVVRVPKRFFDQAKQILAEAEAAGPEAADEAERAGEDSDTD
jgi:hypothetical protein